MFGHIIYGTECIMDNTGNAVVKRILRIVKPLTSDFKQ